MSCTRATHICRRVEGVFQHRKVPQCPPHTPSPGGPPALPPRGRAATLDSWAAPDFAQPRLLQGLPRMQPPNRLECDESPAGLTMPPARASFRALLWSYPLPGGNPLTPALPGESWVFTAAVHDSQDI